ncbi:LOW QUALITY PROTEIN: four-jointed box protein 1 [Marmota marmota marmota]|uniref:LOW QUALITY PROTEIN: four-jointed box protein 1 n=1 Tax=Marmota marmota marmota TaxID=9994 RepID=UPI00209357E1|nr:LOW QUALITY PROTEIN: four-jointed box protein 1 [Marmota marmota marmota]
MRRDWAFTLLPPHPPARARGGSLQPSRVRLSAAGSDAPARAPPTQLPPGPRPDQVWGHLSLLEGSIAALRGRREEGAGERGAGRGGGGGGGGSPSLPRGPGACESRQPEGLTAKYKSSWEAAARRVPSAGQSAGQSPAAPSGRDGAQAPESPGANKLPGPPRRPDPGAGARLEAAAAAAPARPARVEARGAQWAQVQEELRAAHWAEGSVVSLTRWLPNLTDVVVPAPWRSEDGRLRPLRDAGGELANLSQAELVDLVQWTDLILFDYLTANFDRLVSNLFSLQWDPRVMQRATSNLHRGPGGALVFLDNEAGLVHGYRVAGMWDKYNEPLLQSVCVFRERTARRVLELHRGQDAAARLLRLYRRHEPRFPELAALADPHAQLLQRRLDFLAKHILHCKAKYGRRPGT